MPGLRSRVASLLRTRKAILMLSGSMKSIPLVKGIRATLDVVGVKRAERAWEVLHVLSTLDVVDIGASELVVQRFDKLILDRLGHVLHLFIHYAASGSLA